MVELYQKKFKCIDDGDMFVNGDFDSNSARLISIRLNRCTTNDQVQCKSEEQITEFFRNKLLLLMYN